MKMLSRSLLAITMLLLAANAGGAQIIPVPTPKPTKTSSHASNETEQTKPELPRIYQSACPAVLSGKVKAKRMPPITEDQCGERSPLEVAEISGIKLTTKAILNCRMATELVGWLEDADGTAQTILQTNISSIITSTSYNCRRRNNAPTGKISEHGFANAVDIIGFNFSDGSKVTLLEDWPLPPELSDEQTTETIDEQVSEPAEITKQQEMPALHFLKTIRDQACERFTTVLGPEANRWHADHFHFDLGCHGKTCTYKLCE